MSIASTTSNYVPLPEIMIFPNRLLYAETTEKVVNRIREIEHVVDITLHGETLPEICKLGPATGLPVNHPERRTIKVGDREELLTILVGTFYLKVDDVDNVDAVIEEIEKACDELLVHGYSLEVGRYSRYKPTVSDHLKGLR